MPRKELWVPLEQAAIDVCGLPSTRGFPKIRDLLPTSAIRIKEGARGAPHEYRVRDLVLALEQSKQPAEGDDLLAGDGSQSPALEEYRAGKAVDVWMDVDERMKSHANLNDLNTMLVRFGSHIHTAGEVLQRRFGNEASEILNTAIDDAARVCQEEIRRCIRADADAQLVRDHASNGDRLAGVTDSADSDDAPVRTGRNHSSKRSVSRPKAQA